LLLIAAESPETEQQRYHVKVYNPVCTLLATGVLNLRVAEPDENGIRRVTGYRTFDPHVDYGHPFGAYSWQLIGRIEGETIYLDLDRNVLDSNTHVRGRMIDSPEPGFEGTWQFVGWALGPTGRIIAARAPHEPTKPCEDLPKPVTARERMERMMKIIDGLESRQESLPENKQDRPSDPSQDEGGNGDGNKNEGGDQDS
jgi:hypothetical protein